MADVMALRQAQATCQTVCRSLDSHNLKYSKNESEFRIEFNMSGDDIPMSFILIVDAERQVFRLISPFPFKTPEDKRLDMAIAVSMVNNTLVVGAFSYDIGDGSLHFRVTNSFHGSLIGEDTFGFLLYAAVTLIDKYNDRFMMLAKGMISLEQFMENESK